MSDFQLAVVGVCDVYNLPVVYLEDDEARRNVVDDEGLMSLNEALCRCEHVRSDAYRRKLK